MKNWFYSKNGGIFGPYDEDEFKSLARSGTFGRKDFVLEQGTEDWKLAGSMNELFDFPPEKKHSSSSPKDTPDGTVPLLDQAERDLRLGIDGYRIFQGRLAKEVSPEEAHEAELACTKRKRWFWIFATAMLLCYLGKATLESIGLGTAIILYADGLLNLLITTAILFFVGWLRVSYAGRILFPLQLCFVLTAAYTPQVARLAQFTWDPILGGVIILAGFLLGWLMDWSCCLKKERPLPLLRRIGLSLVAGIIAINAYVQHMDFIEVAGYWPVFLQLTVILLLVFAWWPQFPIPRAFRLGTRDAETVFDAAIMRWSRVILGRALAIAFCSFPLFMLINNLGMEERFSLEGKDYPIVTTDINGTTHWAYDYRKGRLFETRDLQQSDRKFYWFDPEKIDQEVRKELESIEDAWFNDPTKLNAPRLYELLEPYHVTQPMDFGEKVKAGMLESKGVMIEIEELTPERFSSQDTIYSMYYPLLGFIDFYSTDHIELFAKKAFYLNWATVIFGLVATILLWRRGGDSEGARWIGIWLAALTVGLSGWISGPYLPSFTDSALKLPMESSFGSLASGPFLGLMGMNDFLTILNNWHIPLAFIWTYFCWPTKSLIFSPWKGRLLFVLKSLIIVGLCYCIHLVFGKIGWQTGNHLLAWALGWLVQCLLMVTVGIMIRNRAGGSAPPLGVLPASAFLCCITGWVLMWFVTQPINLETNVSSSAIITKVHLFGIPALLFLFAFLALSGFAMLRRDFLHMSETKGLFYLLLAILLPALIEVSQWASVKVLTSLSLSTQRGAEIFGIALAVFILVPMERHLHRLLTRMSVRKLNQIEERVSEAVESICEVYDRKERRQRISDALLACGITSYSLYFRQAPDNFVFYSRSSDSSSVVIKEITLSEHCLKALREHNGFLDLEHVCREWDFFFHQFELFRIEKRLDCRYVMPIKLGNSLRGLLLLPKNEVNEKIIRAPLATQLSTFGVAAFERPSN